jgi:hypothetical protein
MANFLQGSFNPREWYRVLEAVYRNIMGFLGVGDLDRLEGVGLTLNSPQPIARGVEPSILCGRAIGSSFPYVLFLVKERQFLAR